MLSVQKINGKEYVSAYDAGVSFGYSKEYILLLLKQEKLVGEKIKGKWYVDPHSVELFFKNAAKEKEARRDAIRKERKEELKRHQTLRTQNGYKAALLETLVIVIIGLSLGATGYVGTTSQVSQATQGEYGILEHLAITLYRLISPEDIVTTEEIHIPPEAAQVSSAIGTTTHTSLIVAPDEVMTTTTVEDIRDAFSDDVMISVDPEHPDTGIITPIFRDREGDPYRFLMVPVTEAKQP